MSYKKGDVVVVKFPFVLKEGTAEIAEIAEGKKYNAFVVSGDLSGRSLKSEA